MYTIKDSNSRVTVSSFADAVHNISEWYQDYASWATGTATHEENQIVRDAIDSVDQPEFGGDLQDYADKICQAIATAVGGKDFHGHGNYAVSAADQMGLSLTVEAASEDIADGVYFLHPDGSDWVAVQMNGGKIVGMTSGADAATHNAARDSWAGVEPSDDDTEIEGDEAYTIVRIYAAYIGRDIDGDCVAVSKPAADDDEPQTATITVTWSEISGEGRLIARCDENPTYSSNVVRWENPIDASTDSWAIAHAVTSINGAEIIAVDHERDTVLVTVSNEIEKTETTVCGHAVQYDKSGVGHCWVNIDRSEIPASIVEELEGEMIDGGKDSCDSFRASNGIHYRW